MKSAFDKIAAGIEDAIAFAEGRDSKAKVRYLCIRCGGHLGGSGSQCVGNSARFLISSHQPPAVRVTMQGPPRQSSAVMHETPSGAVSIGCHSLTWTPPP